MEPPSKRIAQRHEVSIPVTVDTGDEKREAVITNLSVGGLYIEDEGGPYSPRAVVGVTFSIPTLDEPISVEINVRWVNRAGDKVMGFGAQFIGLTAKEVWALTKFFSSAHQPTDGE